MTNYIPVDNVQQSTASNQPPIPRGRGALKELKESRVWLMFASRLPGSPDTARPRTMLLAATDISLALLSESRELTLIFGKSVNTASQGRG